MGAKKRNRRPSPDHSSLKAGKQMRMDNFLEEREEEETGVEVDLLMDLNASSQDAGQLLSNNRYALLQGNSPAQDNEADQQPFSRSPRIQLTTNQPLKKVNYENIILKQTSLISETLLSLYAKIDEINIKVNRLKETVQSLAWQLQTMQPQRECSCPGLIEPTAASPLKVTNPEKANAPQSSTFQSKNSRTLQTNQLAFLIGRHRVNYGRFKGGHQKEDVLAEQPEAFQVDYELDPPVLFSINPDDNRGLLGGFKSLAEELMDATEQPMNQQPLNQHLVLVSQPAPENPSPRSIGKVKNGCVLDKQIFEEIEMIAPTAGEAILEVTSPEDYRDSNIK
ncbi:UNVERIFIED_CONTAM: hypothetical protein K2H54_003781 [Gekko kuhli]